MSYCNESLYIIQNKNECGLCKDLNTDKPYKIITGNECLEEKPENTYYIYEKLKILNYCYDSCKTCFSNKEYDCLSCYSGYKLVNGECKKEHKNNYIIFIIIILLIIIILICAIFIFYYKKINKNKNDSELINKIKIELKNN